MKNILLIIALLFGVNVNAQEIKFGKVSKEELNEKMYPLDSTADAAYLLKNKNIYYEYDGDSGWRLITETHERIKIYNKNGFKYATNQISLFGSGGTNEKIDAFKAYTFNLKNNNVEKTKLSKKNIIKEKKNKNWTIQKSTMPNLKEQCIIEWKYRVSSPYWTSINEINLQEFIPIKKTEISVKIPEYMIFKKHSNGYLPIALTEIKKSKQFNYQYRSSNARKGEIRAVTKMVKRSIDTYENIYNINQKNTIALKEEPYTNNINNYRSSIKFELGSTQFPSSILKYYSQTWEDVSKTIYKSPSFGKELNRNNYYKNDIKAIISSTQDPYKKTDLIFQFVKQKIKWNKHFGKYTNEGVKKAYKEGLGNSAEINLILTSMLRFAGLDANPVLVSTKNNGIPLFPTREGYNYVISKVNFLNGKYILLDATEKYSYQNILPYRVLNWYGREIDENSISKEISLTPSGYAEKKYLLHVKLNESGTVEGILRKSLVNHAAMSYRQKNNVIKKEDLITSLEEGYNIEIEDFKLIYKDNFSKPVTLSLKFSGEDFIEEINNKLYFSPLLFLTKKENPFKSKERNFPIDYRTPWKNTFSIAITIPENYNVESFPEDLAIGLPENMGVFKYKIAVIGSKIKLSSVLQINTSIVTPEYYTVLKDFYTQLLKKQSEKIVLIKK